MRHMFALIVSACVFGQNIDIPDANFKTYLIENSWIDGAGVAHPYDSNGDGEISVEEAAAVTTDMNCEMRGIADLTGLEHFVNLTVLNAYSNAIASVVPLAPLIHLTAVNLSNNQITLIDSLANLTNLTYLALKENAIQDISPLSGLTNLSTLYLGVNPITDPTPIAGLTQLMDLELHQIGITDISFLSGLTTLERLHIRDNNITDVSPLNGLVNLNYLDLSHNEISDISSLASLIALETLWIESNRIENIQVLSNLTGLSTLGINGNQISDLQALSGLTNLTHLEIQHNQIADLSPLSGLTQLTALHGGSNQINNVSPLASLTNLQFLYLHVNQIADINPLSALNELQDLYLRSNQITDLNGLASLTQLDFLSLSENQITDIGPVSTLTQLRIVTFRENQVADVRPLANLVNLTYLHLGNNRIQDIASLSSLVNLNFLGLWGNEITDINALAGLENLTKLSLSMNPISNIEPIANLRNLSILNLGDTALSDISVLAGLNSLEILMLWDNQIADVTPLSDLVNLTTVDLNGNLLENVSPLLGIEHGWFEFIDLNFNLLDSQDCTVLLALRDKTNEFYYQQQKETFIDCDAAVDNPYGTLSAPTFVSADRVWINDAGNVVVNLPHPNIDGWDPSTQIPIQYVLNFLQNDSSMDEITVSVDTPFPFLSELGAPPTDDYFVSIKRQAIIGGNTPTMVSQAVLVPGPRQVYGQQIASNFAFIDRWLFHIPKQLGGFDAKLTLTNRFPELPAMVKLIGFDSQGRPIDRAEKDLALIGRRKEWSVCGDTAAHLFPSELQDEISHVGIFEPKNTNFVLVSLTYVNLASDARSNTQEVNLKDGKGGSKFLPAPTETGAGDAKWDGIAALNMRNDTETPVWLDQASTQTDEEAGTSHEVIHRSVSLGSIAPGGKLLYAISESEFPFIEGAYYLLRTENPSQKIQALALHGGPGFLAVNNEFLLLE